MQTFIQFVTQLTEGKTEKVYVDNSEYKDLAKWLKSNEDVFRPIKNAEHSLIGDPSVKWGPRHKDTMDKLVAKGFDASYPYGRCHVVASFVYYSLGGYSSDYNLMCIDAKHIPFTYKGIKSTTSHWYVQHKTSGHIIDLTRDQFDRMGVDIDDKYKHGKRSAIGWTWYHTKKHGKRHYKNVVPSMHCLQVYDRYRSDVKKIPHLEYWHGQCLYATERR